MVRDEIGLPRPTQVDLNAKRLHPALPSLCPTRPLLPLLHVFKWIYGHIPELPQVRMSARTRSWRQAQRRARELEIQFEEQRARLHSVVLEKAVAAFIAHQHARKLQRVSVSKSETLLNQQLLPWCRQRGVTTLNDLTSEKLLEFRNQWALAPATARRKHEGLQSLFLFCLKHKWIYHSPMLVLKKAIRAKPRAHRLFSSRRVQPNPRRHLRLPLSRH